MSWTEVIIQHQKGHVWICGTVMSSLKVARYVSTVRSSHVSIRVIIYHDHVSVSTKDKNVLKITTYPVRSNLVTGWHSYQMLTNEQLCLCSESAVSFRSPSVIRWQEAKCWHQNYHANRIHTLTVESNTRTNRQRYTTD